MKSRTITRLVFWLLIFGGLYYLWSFVGLVTGFINYGGPANQGMALLLAVISVAILVRLKIPKILFRA